MFVYLPLLVLVIGALAYGLSKNPEVKEMGRLSFACGLLVFLFVFATHSVTLPH